MTTARRDRRILSALLTVSSFTAAAKIASAAKVLLIAHRFGVAAEIDAFFIAFLLPSFFADISAASTTAALIPTLVEERQRHGRDAAMRLSASITFWSALLLGLATLGVALTSTLLVQWIASGFNESQRELTRDLLLGLLPILLLTGIAATWRAILNAEHDYALAASSYAITPLVTIVAVVAWSRQWGVYALVAGSVAGAVIEALCLAAGLWRRGLLSVPAPRCPDAPVRRVLRQYVPALGSSLVLNASGLVSQAMAAMLGPGNVSALNYGAKLVSVILAVGPVAMGTAALPHFAEMAARSAWATIWSTFRSYLRLVSLTAIPATAILIAFSEPVARLLYQRGQFTAADTMLVAEVQRYYLLQVPVAMLVALGARLLSSLKHNDALLWGALIAVAAQVLLTRALADSMGVAGIALAASASVFIYLCYLLGVLLRWNRAVFSPEFSRRGICDSRDH